MGRGQRLKKWRQWLWSLVRRPRLALRRSMIEALEPREVCSVGWDVALVDTTLPNDSLLTRALLPGGHVIRYDGRNETAADVLSRVSRWADDAGVKVGSVSLLSHASAGRFSLGSDWISRSSLDETADAWAALGRVMADGGSINLYGCSLADPFGDGQVLIDRIAKLAGANVFASDDLTGRGGDWVLEAASRGATTPYAGLFNLAELVQWDGTLGAPVAAGGESRVNTTTADTQRPTAGRAVAVDAAGNSVVVWTGFGQDGDTAAQSNVYAQRYDAAGMPVGGEILVNASTGGVEDAPAVAMDAAGRFVVAWVADGDRDGGGLGVYARRFDAAGIPLGGEFPVNTWTAGDQSEPTVAMDATGKFVIAWTSTNQDAVGKGVFAQRYDAAGAAQGTEFQVNTTTADDQSQPAAATDADGDFVIAYSGQGQDGDSPSQSNVYARRYDEAGVAQGLEFLVNTVTGGDQFEPAVGIDALGNVVVTWAGSTVATGYGVFAQRFGTTGAAAGGEFQVDTFVTGDQREPAVAVGADGDFVVTWASNGQDAGGDWGVYAQAFTAAGIAQGGEFRVSTTEAGDQRGPAAAMNAGGKLTVAWGGALADDTAGVAAQGYTVNDAPVTADVSARAGVAFDGDDSLRVASPVGMTMTGQLTLEAWVFPQPGGPATQIIMNKEGEYELARDADGTLKWSLANTTPGWSWVSSGHHLPLNRWTHVAVTYDGAAVRTYADGALVHTYAASGAIGDNYPALNEFRIGSRQNNLAAGFNGLIDEVRVWSTARTDAEITGAMNTQLTGAESGLAGSWLLDEAAGLTASDQSPNANHATLGHGVAGSEPAWVHHTTAEDTTLTVAAPGALATAGDMQGDSLTAVLVTGPTNAAAFTLNPDGSFSYTPAADFAGTDSFTYKANDGTEDSAPVTVQIAVAAVNDAPAAAADAYSVNEDASLTVAAAGAGVLANDTDVEGTTLSVVLETGPADGSLTLNADGSFTYTPDADFWGTDSFTYRASDGSATSAPVTVTITVNPVAGVSVSPTSGLTTTEAGGQATFQVVLTSRPTADVTIGLSSSDTTEGTVSPVSLVFTAADWDTPQTVTVTGADDPDDDGNIAYSVVTAAATSGDAGYNGLNPADVSVTSTDNDAAGITVTPTAGLVTTEAGGAATFSVVLDSRPTGDVTIGLTSSDTTEGTVSAASLVFTASDWNTPQTVTVTGAGDFVDDGNIGFTIVTAAATSTDAGYNGLNPADVSVSNTDDDTAGVTVTPTSGITTTETGGTTTFSLVLDSQPAADVTIALSSNDTGEGTVGTSSVTFTVLNWNAPQTVTVTGVDDTLIDGTAAYTIVTGAAVSADPLYSGLAVADVSVVNADNERGPLALGSEFRVNTTTADTQATFFESPRAVASDADGNFVVTWSSLSQDGGGWGVYARRYNAAGVAQGGEILVNTTTALDQRYATVAMSASGGFVIAWATAGEGGSNFGVRARRFDAAGVAQGGEIQVNTTTAGDQQHASVAADAVGNFVVVWQGVGPEIFGQRFNAAGAAQGGEFRVNTYGPNDQSQPSVAMDAAGNYLVAWTSQGQDGAAGGVFAQRYNAAGVAQGGEFRVNTQINGDESHANVAAGPGGEFVVTWTRTFGTSISASVQAQRYSAAGVAQGGEFEVNTTAVNDQAYSSAAVDGDGNFLVTWSSWNQDGGGWGVYAQKYDAAGSPLGGELRVNSTTAGDQVYSSVAVDANGDAVIVWSGNGTGDTAGVFGQTYAVNDAPAVGVPGAQTVAEDTPLVFSAANGNAISVTDADAAAAGGAVRVTLTAVNGALSLSGTAGLTFVSGDGTSDATMTFTGTVAAVNTALNGMSFLPAGNYSGAASVQVTADDQGSYGTGGAMSDSDTVAVTVAAVNDAPTAAADAYSVNEDASLTVAAGSGVLANDADVEGTALTAVLMSGPANGSLTLNADGSFTYTPNADFWGTDSFTYRASDGGAQSGIVTVSLTVTRQPGVSVSPTSGLTTTEAGGQATFQVVLTSRPTADVTIGLSSSDTTEGTVSATALTFTTANWNVPQTVTVTGADDFVDDGNVGFTIVTAAATSADAGYAGLDPANVSVSTTDDDTAGITVSPTAGLATTEAGGTAQFSVVLDSQPTADVTIAVSSSDTTEGTVSPASLVFTAANWNVARSVTVTGVNDFAQDGDIAYSVVTAAAGSADPNYNNRNAADVSVTNADNDVAGISVTPTAGLVTTEAGGAATFSVALDSQPFFPVTIGVSSTDTTEGTVSAASLTFTAADWSIPQTVTVTGADDPDDDGNIAYSVVTAAAATSLDGGYSGMDAADVSVSNTDNDTAGITVTPTSGFEVSEGSGQTRLVTTEGGGAATFTVVLDTRPTADVTIALSSSDTTEGTVSPAALVFTATDWNVARTVTVTGANDTTDDGNLTYTVLTGAATSGDPQYAGMDAADVAAVNQDNDIANVAAGAEVRTNATAGDAQRTFFQTPQAVASDADGDYVVAWSGLNQDAVGGWGIFAQRYNAAGIAQGGEFRVNTSTAGDQQYAAVSMDDTGNFVVIWSSYGQDAAGGWGVYGQRYNAAGVAQGGEFRVNTTTAGDQQFASVAMDADGDFVVAWQGGGSQDGAGWGVFARRFSAAGVAQGGEFAVNTTTALDQTHASVAADNAGNFVVAWQSLGQDGDAATDANVYARRFNAAGAASGGEFRVNAYTVGTETLPSVAADADGDFVVSWSIYAAGASSESGVVARRFNAAGVAQGLDFVVNTFVDTDQTYAAAAMDAAGNFVITWSSFAQDAAGGWGVYGQRYLASGLAQGAEFRVNTTTAGDQVNSSVAASGDGDFVIAWSGSGAGDTDGVFHQRYAGPGITVWPTAALVTTETGGTATFSVVLNNQPTADVTVGLSSSDTTEGTVSVSSLTFTAANWNVPRTVTIAGAGDFVDDGDIAYSVVTAPATSADPNYANLAAADVSVTNTDDDTAGITVSPTAGLVTTEAGGQATFTVALDSQPTGDVTIPIASGDASEGSASVASVTFTPANWNVARTVTVTGANDPDDDGDIAYGVVTGAATSTDPNYSGRNAADVSLTNTDNDTAGVTVTPTGGLTTTEAGGAATFGVVLDSRPSADVTIAVSSTDPTEGTPSVTSLTFTAANWNVAQTVTVAGAGDFLDDGDIAYGIVTAPAGSADPLYNGMNPADVSLTNTDDDDAGITVSPTAGLVTTEAGGTASFNVVLDSQPYADVVVGIDLGPAGAGEGALSTSALTFTAADWNVPQVVTVTGVNDSLDDGDVAYSVATAAATSTDAGYAGRDAADVSLVNTDDDTAGITVTPGGPLTTTEGGGTADFQVVLDSQPYADVVVAVGLGAGGAGEGTLSAASLTFTAANWNVAQTVTVTGVNDDLDDGDASYAVVTAAVASADAGYAGINPADVSVTNTDDDTAGISVTPTAGLVTTEAGGAADFQVVLDSQPYGDVVVGVDLGAGGADEGTLSATALTFTPANWNVPQTVTVTGADENLDDRDVAYTVAIAPATSSDAGYAGLDAADVSVTNTDDDTAGISVTPTGGLTTTEAGGSADFQVVLTSQPYADVVVSLGLSPAGAGEGTLSATTLTFTAADWNVPQTVTVTGTDERVDDGDIAYSVMTAPAVSADGGYDGIDAADVAVTNTDDDAAGFVVTPVAGLTTTEAGGTATFTVALTSRPLADVTVAIGSSDSAEGTAAATALTFTAADWDQPQTVVVTGTDERIDDGDAAYTIITAAAASADVTYDGLDPADVSLTNTDDDAAGIVVTPGPGSATTEAGGVAGFFIVLSSQPTADVVIALGSSDTTEGGAAVDALTFTAADWDTPQAVIVTGADDWNDDGDVGYTIITAATSADPNYAGRDAADVPLTNLDDDAAGITVSPIAGLVTTEAGGVAGFQVVLTSQPYGDVAVGTDIGAGGAGEGTLSTAVLTFTAADWNVPQTGTVTGVDDRVDDGDATYTVTTSPAVSTDGGYDGIDAADVSVTNTDDDTAGITVTPTVGLTTTERGGTAEFAVVLDSRPTADVTVAVRSADPTEGAALTVLTFSPETWDRPQNVGVTGTDDDAHDGDVTYVVVTDPAASADPKYAGTDAADVTIINLDGDPDATATAAPLDYSENDGPVTVDPNLVVADPDDTSLDGATVAITSGYVPGEDGLTWDEAGAEAAGVRGDWDPAAGVLTLSGPAAVADYQTALRSVAYENRSEAPSEAPRSVEFGVRDAGANRARAGRQVSVRSVNDAPTQAVPGSLATEQDTPLVLSTEAGNAVRIADVDAGDSPVRVTLAADKGSIALGPAAAGLRLEFTMGRADGKGSRVIEFAGSVADVNAALEGMRFTPARGFVGVARLKINTEDGGARGWGGPGGTSSATAITVTGRAEPQQDTEPAPVVPPPVDPAPPVEPPAEESHDANEGDKSARELEVVVPSVEPSNGGADPRPAAPEQAPAPAPAPAPIKRTEAAAPAPAAAPVRVLRQIVTAPATLVPSASQGVTIVNLADTALWTQLNKLSEQMDMEQGTSRVTIGTATGSAALLSIGYVIWVMRGMSLAGSFLAALPLWRWVDPLPVLDSWDRKKEKDEEQPAGRVRRHRRRRGEPAPIDNTTDEKDEQRLRSLTE